MRLIAPPESAVTLADAKDFLRVVHDTEDAKIASLLAAATAHFDGPEGRLRKAIMPQTWEASFDAFPADGGAITLKLGPVLEVISVVYESGGAQTLAEAAYIVDVDGGRIAPVSAWPTTDTTLNAVTVTWVAGMSADSPPECPADIQAAIKLQLGDLYDGTDTAVAIEALIHNHKRIVLV